MRNLINLIKTILNIAWYGIILLVVFVIGFIMVLSITDPSELLLTVAVEVPSASVVESNTPAAIQLNHTEALLTIQDMGGWFYGLLIYSSIIEIGMALAVIFLLRKCFQELANKQFFSVEIARNVRWIGFLCILILPLQLLKLFIFGPYVKGKAAEIGYDLLLLPFKNAENLSSNQLIMAIDYDFNLLFIGLVILVIAEVFRQGVIIKQENEAFV